LFKKTISCHSAFMNLAIREKVAYIEISWFISIPNGYAIFTITISLKLTSIE
jgi:hypothetical protein